MSSRKSWDPSRIAEAIKRSGIDTRHWVSYATVATTDNDGNIDAGDPGAIYVGPEGVEVDVVLEPLGIPITCHYAGLQGGPAVTFFTPIKPGDRVLVVLPEGDLHGPPVITSILHSAHNKVPLGNDRKPIFKNDRVFLWSEGVDIDIRTKNGAKAELKQNGTANVTASTVNLGGSDATEKLIKGTSYRAKEKPAMEALKDWVDAVSAAIAATPPVPAPNKAAVAAAVIPLDVRLALFNAEDFLSDVSKTK